MGLQGLSHIRQLHTLRVALEQRCANLLLEPADGATQRRLRHVQGVSRPPKASDETMALKATRYWRSKVMLNGNDFLSRKQFS